MDDNPDADEGSLRVELAAASDPCARQMDVSTDRGEVTICFACAHCHIDWPDDDWREGGPLLVLRDIFADRYLAEESFVNRRWTGSGFPVKEIELDPLPGVITLVSLWSGRFDRFIDRSGERRPEA